MLRKHKHRKSQESFKVNTTPLMDLTFVILVFFVALSQFNKPEATNFALQSKNFPLCAHSDCGWYNRIIISIDSNDIISFNENIIMLEDISIHAQSFLNSSPRAVSLVKVHPDASMNSLMRVVDQLKSVGLKTPSVKKWQ